MLEAKSAPGRKGAQTGGFALQVLAYTEESSIFVASSLLNFRLLLGLHQRRSEAVVLSQ